MFMRNCWHLLSKIHACRFSYFVSSACMVSCQHFLLFGIISYAKLFLKKTFSLAFFVLCLLRCVFLHSVKTNLNSGGAVSKLYIANANRNDSGNYTCLLGETAQTTIAVHVLNGMYGLLVIYYFGRNNSSFSSLSSCCYCFWLFRWESCCCATIWNCE